MSNIELDDNSFQVLQNLTPSEIYGKIDMIGKTHMRPISDNEYFGWLKVIKNNSVTGAKYSALCYALATTILANFFAFQRDDKIDDVVNNVIDCIGDMPVSQIPYFWAKLKSLAGSDNGGLGVPLSLVDPNLYSDAERHRFGAAGIAFVDEYNKYMAQRNASQQIVDSAQSQVVDQVSQDVAQIAVMNAAPALVAASNLVATAPIMDLSQKPVTYIHPMLAYGYIPRR